VNVITIKVVLFTICEYLLPDSEFRLQIKTSIADPLTFSSRCILI